MGEEVPIVPPIIDPAAFYWMSFQGYAAEGCAGDVDTGGCCLKGDMVLFWLGVSIDCEPLGNPCGPGVLKSASIISITLGCP